MLIKNKKIIESTNAVIFGRGSFGEQIEALFSGNILSMCDDNHNFEFIGKDIPLIFAVGYKNLYNKNQKLKQLIDAGYNVCTFIAENAIISQKVNVGNGIIIHEGVIIDNFVTLMNGVVLNIGVKVAHNTIIDECTFVAPGVTICGNVEIGKNSFIGAGSTIIDGIKVGSGSVIAAGAVVIRDVPENCLVAGVPAQIKQFM